MERSLARQPVIIEKDLSYKIVQAAFEVHNQLGPGFQEAIYEKAFIHELGLRGIPFESQRRIPVLFKGTPVGEYILDLVVEDRIIVELKAVSEILDVHKGQALAYLKATGLALAIVINFGASKLQYNRVILTTRNHSLEKT